jgi:hypothetical protein
MVREFGEEEAERILQGVSCLRSMSATVLHRGLISGYTAPRFVGRRDSLDRLIEESCGDFALLIVLSY